MLIHDVEIQSVDFGLAELELKKVLQRGVSKHPHFLTREHKENVILIENSLCQRKGHVSAPIRFISVAVSVWNGSSGSGLRFRQFR